MTIHNLEHASAILKCYVPAVKEITGKDITLQRVSPLMELLGNPEAKLKIIHIAGTSGKTSTAYYAAALLQASGQKVGLTISPHITAATERIQINLQPISEAAFCVELSKFLNIIKDADPQPTYFELLVAFSYWYFAKVNVDYAVIETGLGGLHDATNVAIGADKVCVLTDIGLDHVKVLGDTLAKIATQKAGIIGVNNHVFCYKQNSEIMKVFRECSACQQATLHVIASPDPTDLGDGLPLFQRRNWNLARAASNFISQRDQLSPLSESQLAGTKEIIIPARMEVVKYKDKIIIFDGAHNTQKLRTLTVSIRQRYPHQPMAVLVGFVRSRKQRVQANLRQLLPGTKHLIATSFIPNQEMYTHCTDPAKIVLNCQELDFDNCSVESNPEKAFQMLLERPEPILLVTGSFYLMHHYHEFIRRQHD